MSELFDDLIQSCNYLLWTHMYQGAADNLFATPQHRDIVRAFMAGVIEGYLVTRSPTLRRIAESVLKEMEPMTKPDWLPDARFHPTAPRRNSVKEI